VSWVWAANGTASVAGAILATVIALAAGFTTLGLVASICYIAAALTPPDRLGRPPATGRSR